MLATDGILDNVWPQELETIVKTIMADQGTIPDEQLIHKIAQTTVRRILLFIWTFIIFKLILFFSF